MVFTRDLFNLVTSIFVAGTELAFFAYCPSITWTISLVRFTWLVTGHRWSCCGYLHRGPYSLRGVYYLSMIVHRGAAVRFVVFLGTMHRLDRFDREELFLLHFPMLVKSLKNCFLCSEYYSIKITLFWIFTNREHCYLQCTYNTLPSLNISVAFNAGEKSEKLVHSKYYSI